MQGYRPLQEDESRQAAILAHLPQVRLVARQIHERLPDHVSLDDLISTGTIGLISAIDRFDASHNTQLKTYAEHKIRGAILDSLRELDWAPRQCRKKSKQIEEATCRLEQRLSRAPSEEEVAAELRIGVEEYRQWLTDVRGVDLENLECVSGSESVDLLRFIPDDESKLPSHCYERSEIERLVGEAIDKMPKPERTVLSLYYREELSVREIAEVMRIHFSRVSQLKAQAILRMRAYLGRKLFVQPPSQPPPAEQTTPASPARAR